MLYNFISIILLIHITTLGVESLLYVDVAYGFYCEYTGGLPSTLIGNKGVNVAFLVDNGPNIPERYKQLLSTIVNNLDDYYTDRYGTTYYGGMCLYSDTAVWAIRVGDQYRFSISAYIMHSNDTALDGTRTDSGFQAVEQELSLFADDKSFAPSMCILLTTSPPDNTSLATAAADSLKDSGVNIIVIAVGDDVDEKDVENLASNDKAVFAAGKNMSYSEEEIHNQAEDVTKAVSTALQHAFILPKYKWCYEAGINIIIIIDIKQYHVKTIKQLADFVFEFSLYYASVKTMVINSPMEDESFRETFHSVEVTAQEVELKIFGSEYNLSSSIRRSRRRLLTPTPDLQEKLIVVATDSTDLIDDVILESRACQESGIHIMALGVGPDVSEDQLSNIITDQRGIAIVHNYDAFRTGLGKLYRNLCAGVCHRGWVYHDGMCSTYRSKDEPWIAAQKSCTDLKAKLVSITTANKYRWVREEFLDKHNKATHIGLRKHTLKSAPISSEFRWENGKPLVFSDWNRLQTPPEPDGAAYESCVAWYPDGWRDVVCTVLLGAGSICEREADNATKPDMKGVEILPLWKENVCPVHGFDPQVGPVVATGTDCRDYYFAYCISDAGQQTGPVLAVHWLRHELKDIYNCSNGELISSNLLCDGEHHCQDGSDEFDCASGCSGNQFHCPNGRCISMGYFCDFWDDCGDNSDEKNCVAAPCPLDSWQCNSGQCIADKARCDLYYDCFDKSDETECSDTCQHDRCDDGTCVPSHWLMDGVVDCAGGRFEDEVDSTSWRASCFKGRYREMFYLCDDYIKCPIGFYRCPSSYCIPIERVCDGVMDCIDGEEEVDCDKYECPGYFRCPGVSYCVHPARVCDGDVNCPGGKDEVSCDVLCPDNCICSAGLVQCSDAIINESSLFYPSARKVVVTNSMFSVQSGIFKDLHYLRDVIVTEVGLTSLQDVFIDQINLIELNVSHNRFDELPGGVLSNQTELRVLDLSYNPLQKILKESFTGLKNLKELHMKYTRIESLLLGSFSPLVKLEMLDIRGTSLKVIADEAFSGLSLLKTLYTQGNPITKFGQNIFHGLRSLEEFHTDVYSLCCPQLRPKALTEANCVSPKSSISSCSDLLASDILRSSIWILCIASLVGNIVSTAMRLAWERNSMRNGFGVFVSHLGIADFLMGIYLLIIAVADTKYKGVYIWHDYDWRQSIYCKIAGALSTLSSEASTFFICLITLDRFIIIKFPFGQLRFRYKSATVSAILAWILAIVIVIVPMMPSLSHWNFYNRNGACLAVPFSTERKPGWAYSVVIFTGLNFAAFIIIAIGQFSIYRAMKESSFVTSKERRAQEMAVARRLLLIVATDFLCWFPVGIMSLLALSGVAVGGEVYAWTAVFILPVNSALNPFLYTIPAVMQKLKKGKETPITTDVSEVTDIHPRLMFGDPGPGQLLLEDVLVKMTAQEEKIKLMKDVCGSVVEFLMTLTPGQPQPNTVYLSMRGKAIDSICLTKKLNSPSAVWISYFISMMKPELKPQKEVKMKDDVQKKRGK